MLKNKVPRYESSLVRAGALEQEGQHLQKGHFFA